MRRKDSAEHSSASSDPGILSVISIQHVDSNRKTVNSHQKSTPQSHHERDFSKVKEMHCEYPTEEEMKDPIVYIEKLYEQGVWKHGCVKIIPPGSFRPPFSFNYKSPQKLPFRSQTVQNLSRGKVRPDC